MNAEVRHALKHAVDQRRRQLVADEPEARPGRTGCAGCGGELDNQTAGCKPCDNRHWRRTWRLEHPAPPSPYREKQGVCSGCGIDHNQRTRGCVPCKKRHFERRKRARLRKVLA